MNNWIDNRDRYIMKPYLDLIDIAVDEFIVTNNSKPVLLEVGCGRGKNLQNKQLAIYEKCQKVIGIDPDKDALDENTVIKEKYVSLLNDLPIKDTSVDIIICAWVLEHVPDPELSIKEIYRVLKIGGSFIFITPNKNSIPGLLNRAVPNILHPIICKLVYRREEEDTYRTEYKLNSSKDLDTILGKMKFLRKDFFFHDDLKFLGSLKIFRPFAYLWNIIVMQKIFMQLRAIIVARYIKY